MNRIASRIPGLALALTGALALLASPALAQDAPPAAPPADAPAAPPAAAPEAPSDPAVQPPAAAAPEAPAAAPEAPAAAPDDDSAAAPEAPAAAAPAPAPAPVPVPETPAAAPAPVPAPVAAPVAQPLAAPPPAVTMQPPPPAMPTGDPDVNIAPRRRRYRGAGIDPRDQRATFATNSATLTVPQPPAAPAENPGAAPSARHVWVSGYYGWNGTQYVWVQGRWDVPPAGMEGARYEPAHWELRRHWRHYEYVYVPAAWQH